MNKVLVSLLFLIFVLVECKENRTVLCNRGSDCEKGSFCFSGICLPDEADDDDDGISNSDEVLLKLNPLDYDTDGDGLSDLTEVSDIKNPKDSDGDGKIDAIESNIADSDGDCVYDFLDSDDNTPLTDEKKLISLLCKTKGVCGKYISKIKFLCNAPFFVCDYSQVPDYETNETLCDGIDNDCNGKTDENSFYNGHGIGEKCDGIGGCGEGVVVCSLKEKVATCSTNPDGNIPQATQEVCDGVDNDCDGETDEGLTLDGIPLGMPCMAEGVCGAGVVVCSEKTKKPVCSTAPDGPDYKATPEECDGLDNDCDGKTDEDLISFSKKDCSNKGVCKDAKVYKKCIAGEWVCFYESDRYEEGKELSCDGLDNDCDGETDEDFTLDDFGTALKIGESCGKGVCKGGKVVCSDDKKGVTCSTYDKISQELCDGLDNDCDGKTDENFFYNNKTVGQMCDGIGICGLGVVECAKDKKKAICSTNKGGSEDQSSKEVCDGLDNDCNGLTDDVLPQDVPQNLCKTKGVCKNYNILPSCIDGSWKCDYEFVENYEDVEKSCDNVDNDCDGFVDEGLKKTLSNTPSPDSKLKLAPYAAEGACSVWDETSKMVFMVGGEVKGYPVLMNLKVYDIVKNSYKTFEPENKIPFRKNCLLVKDGDKLFLLGGKTGDNLFTSEVYEYDLNQNKWQKLFDSKLKFSNGVGAFSGDNLYIFGANTENGNTENYKFDFEKQEFAKINFPEVEALKVFKISENILYVVAKNGIYEYSVLENDYSLLLEENSDDFVPAATALNGDKTTIFLFEKAANGYDFYAFDPKSGGKTFIKKVFPDFNFKKVYKTIHFEDAIYFIFTKENGYLKRVVYKLNDSDNFSMIWDVSSPMITPFSLVFNGYMKNFVNVVSEGYIYRLDLETNAWIKKSFFSEIKQELPVSGFSVKDGIFLNTKNKLFFIKGNTISSVDFPESAGDEKNPVFYTVSPSNNEFFIFNGSKGTFSLYSASTDEWQYLGEGFGEPGVGKGSSCFSGDITYFIGKNKTVVFDTQNLIVLDVINVQFDGEITKALSIDDKVLVQTVTNEGVEKFYLFYPDSSKIEEFKIYGINFKDGAIRNTITDPLKRRILFFTVFDGDFLLEKVFSLNQNCD